MTKPLISPDIIDTLAAALAGIVGDAPLIVADARLAEPALAADSATDLLMDFVGRVLEHCVARLDGARLYPSRTPAADVALAAATLRSIARWPGDRASEADAWRHALNLFLLDAPAPA